MRPLTLPGSSLLMLALAVVGTGTAAPDDPVNITLRSVKYSELGKMIRGLRGQVVIVDFWAEY
jgi:hypothetical protein